jgi:hypothetical protein
MCSAAQHTECSAVQRVALAPQCSAWQRSAAHGSAVQRTQCITVPVVGGGLLCTFQLAGPTKAASSSRRTRRSPSLPHEQPAPQSSVRTRGSGRGQRRQLPVRCTVQCKCSAGAVRRSTVPSSALQRSALQRSAVAARITAPRIGACVRSAVAFTGKELESTSGECAGEEDALRFCPVRGSAGAAPSGASAAAAVAGSAASVWWGVRSKRPMAADTARARRAWRGNGRTGIAAFPARSAPAVDRISDRERHVAAWGAERDVPTP